MPENDDSDRAARAAEDREYVKELCQDVMELDDFTTDNIMKTVRLAVVDREDMVKERSMLV